VVLSGWALFPLLHLALPRLPDRGYAAGRCLGLFLAARVAYLLVEATGTPLNGRLALAGIGVVATLSVAARLLLLRARSTVEGRESIAAFLRDSSMTVATVEALTLAGFLLFAWIAGHHPSVDPGSERFMDYAFLKASLRTVHLPVADPWFAGEPLHYYHFGYAVAAFLVRAALSRPERALIAVIAAFHVLVWIGAFGAGLALTGRRRGGVAAAVLVLGAGNFEWMRQAMVGGGSSGFDWFASSRVVHGAISEFPWFTLLWGDLHPYMMALPLLLGALSIAIGEAIGPWTGTVPRIMVFSFAAGALLATHSWDVPFLILGAVLLIVCGTGRRRLSRCAAWGIAGSLGGALFLPYLINLGQGGRSLALARERSDPRELAMAFGPFVALAALACLARLAGVADGGSNGAGPDADGRDATRQRLALALALLGVLAALLPEVVYLKDFFSATDLARMNTVFKLHRIAWALMGVAAPALVVRPVRDALRVAGRGRRGWIACGLVLTIAFSCVYPVLGTASWLRWRRAPGDAGTGLPTAGRTRTDAGGADALFRALFPGDAAAAAWLGARSGSDDVVLEETGDAYTWSGRISTFSGVPTILGWGNHEAGWRDDWKPILARRKEVDTIYLAPVSPGARALIRRRNITWIVVGEHERRRYGDAVAEGVSSIAGRVFEDSGTAVYRVAGGS
jgi:uncharacterized membrane protein